MTNLRKVLGESKSKTRRNKYEREKEKYKDIELCIHATFRNYFWYAATIIHKICEANSSSHVK